MADKQLLSDRERKAEAISSHRETIKKIFSENGFTDFDVHNLMDILLIFFTPPDIDTLSAAYALVEQYDSMEELFDRSYESLMRENKLPRDAAFVLSLIPALSRYYNLNKNIGVVYIKNAMEMRQYLLSYFYGLEYEVFVMVFLDECGKICDIQSFSQNNINEVTIDYIGFLRQLTNIKPTYVFVAHNHPNGFLIPSKADIILTKKLSELCSRYSVHFCDHLIVGSDDAFFMSDSRKISKSIFNPFLIK